MLIEEFEWDDANEAKVATHGLSPDEIDGVPDTRFVVLKNKRGRAGLYRVVGRGRSGRLITIVIRPTSKRGKWRPVNAWPADTEEQAHARRANV